MSILILGNGLLGTEIKDQTRWRQASKSDNGIDITKPDTLREWITKYDTIVNCIGYTLTRDPNREPSWSVNYIGVMDLVDMCNKYGKKIVHISTDYIYAGSKPFASEDDVPIHFDSWYVYTKLLSDAYVQARAKDYLLIRTSFKPRPYPWTEAWTKLTGNFDYVDVIATKIIALIRKGSRGVYNVGTEEKNMYELAGQTSLAVKADKSDCTPQNITMNLYKMIKAIG